MRVHGEGSGGAQRPGCGQHGKRRGAGRQHRRERKRHGADGDAHEARPAEDVEQQRGAGGHARGRQPRLKRGRNALCDAVGNFI